MTSSPLTRELVKEPARWRLALSFSDSVLDVLATCAVGVEEPVAASIALPAVAASPAAALEEVVYANPLLLMPFGRTDVSVVTSRFHILPPAAAAKTDVLDALDTLFDHDHPVPFVSDIDTRNSLVAMVPRETSRFLRRTFDRAVIEGHLAVLARYFARRSRLGNSGKLFVNLRHDGRVDFFAFDATGLIAANSIVCPDDNDVIYYILAIAGATGLDLHGDELYISGDGARRGTILPELSRWAANVLPLIVPGSLLPGNVNVPIELVVLSHNS